MLTADFLKADPMLILKQEKLIVLDYMFSGIYHRVAESPLIEASEFFTQLRTMCTHFEIRYSNKMASIADFSREFKLLNGIEDQYLMIPLYVMDDADSETALFFASLQTFNKNICALLKIAPTDNLVMDTLLNLLKNDQLDLFSKLLRASLVDINMIFVSHDRSDECLLHAAIRKTYLPLFNLMLSLGANINIVTPKWGSTLEFFLVVGDASSMHYHAMLEQIRSRTPYIDFNALDSQGHPRWFNIFPSGPGQLEGVNYHGLSLDGGSILHYLARRTDYVRYFKKALELGLDPHIVDHHGETAITLVLRRSVRFNEVLRLFLMHGLIEINALAHLLFRAVEAKDMGTLHDLICRNININARNQSGMTALHLAVRNLSIPIIKILIEAGANCNIRDVEGHTPLHKLFLLPNLQLKERYSLAKMLVDAGANLAICDNGGRKAVDYQDNPYLVNALAKASREHYRSRAWNDRKHALAFWCMLHQPVVEVASTQAETALPGHSCCIIQ